jgi:hypothetical protein
MLAGMNRFIALVLIVLLAGLFRAQADSPDDQYVQLFNLIQEADGLSDTQPREALAKYIGVRDALDKFQKTYPAWNPKIVTFRLNYLATRISGLAAKVGGPVTPGPAVAASPAPAQPATAPGAALPQTPAPTPSDWEAQINALKDQVRQLQGDKGLLEAKLKEAFSVQPAAADPRELAKAQDRIRSLQKENDLLRVTLEAEKAKPAPVADTKVLEQVQQALAEANHQLGTQKDLTARLTVERDSLQTRLKALGTGNEATAAIRAENELLKKQLAALTANPPGSNAAADSSRQLAQAQAQMAALQSDKEVLRLEKIALEGRVKQLMAKPGGRAPSLSADPDALARLKQLEQERDALKRQLASLNRDLYATKGKDVAARVTDLEAQLATARARLGTFEARKVPYSPEELALFREPGSQLPSPDPNAGKKSISELPPGSAALVAEAQRRFAAHDYDKAEETYLQVLRRDNKNVPVLANLALIQIESKHYDAAEKNIKAALAGAPDDSYSLYVLGILKFRQAKYDEALDALSRAGQLDPQNAEVQNYLGLTLSEKGLRGPAEAAFRRAIELQPNYGEAQNNLAVFYIFQKPPYTALARWHYQKAIAAGFRRNPDLEKMLDQTK